MNGFPDPILDLLADPLPPPELIEFELLDRPDVTAGATNLDALGDEGVPGGSQVGEPIPLPTVSLEPVPTASYDPSRARENVRGRLALSLVGILAFIVLGAFITLWTGWDDSNQAANEQASHGWLREALAQEGNSSQDTAGAGTQGTPPPEGTPPAVMVTPQQSGLETLLQMLLSPIIGLVGAATGFYFGGLSGKAEGQT